MPLHREVWRCTETSPGSCVSPKQTLQAVKRALKNQEFTAPGPVIINLSVMMLSTPILPPFGIRFVFLLCPPVIIDTHTCVYSLLLASLLWGSYRLWSIRSMKTGNRQLHPPWSGAKLMAFVNMQCLIWWMIWERKERTQYEKWCIVCFSCWWCHAIHK